MNIEFLNNKLLDTISRASRITTNKNLNLPILNSLLLEAKNNKLLVKATNLDLGVEVEVPVKVQKPGSVVIRGDVLSGFLGSLPEEEKSVKIISDGENVELSTKMNKTKIKSGKVEEFPSIPRTKSDAFEMNTEDFIDGLKSVWYSCASSQIKPELSSVYIYSDGDNLIFTATDSFRLAEKKQKMAKIKDFGQVLIPLKNAMEIGKILEGAGPKVSIFIDKNQISLSSDGTFITSRVVDGSFPDYKQIIPKSFETEAVVLKQDLVNALRSANVFSGKFNQINIKALPSKKTLEFKANNPEVGENVSRLDATLSGKDIEINFNCRYISDCLSTINSDSLSLSFTDLAKPMVMKGVNDKSFLYLVMPMNK